MRSTGGFVMNFQGKTTKIIPYVKPILTWINNITGQESNFERRHVQVVFDLGQGK